jgi:hypothetical protein
MPALPPEATRRGDPNTTAAASRCKQRKHSIQQSSAAAAHVGRDVQGVAPRSRRRRRHAVFHQEEPRQLGEVRLVPPQEVALVQRQVSLQLRYMKHETAVGW